MLFDRVLSLSATADTSPLDDDRLVFAEELPGPAAEKALPTDEAQPLWKIMLVDDDPAVHQATKVALKFFTYENRGLSFVSAYSAAEAQQLLSLHPDTVLVLLDVIMKTKDAGLRVARYIREELKNKIVRIVLRTGQPGQVPEESVVVNYDINDYKTKLELTQPKLFTTVVSSIRAYRDLQALAQSQQQLAALNGELQAFNRILEERIRDRTQVLSHEIEEREKTEKALRLYIHALTHDLRNPVTGMANVLHSLLSREHSGEPPSVQIPVSVLTRMSVGCERQLKMISALLETNELEVWGVSLNQQPFAIDTLINDLIEEWQPSFRKKRVSVIVNIQPNLPLVNGDRVQLWRVFENLIDNALKYNPPDITLTIDIATNTAAKDAAKDANEVNEDEANTQKASICCTIQDNGIGISSTQSDQLFGLYQRGSGSGTRGLGLGLYICRRIIEAHGGSIAVSSQPQQGSRFCFTLPQAPELLSDSMPLSLSE
ncbi:MAG: hybrid sensor histidine kinase/response regulator [Cyanobacteria bacterium J06632_3]